MDITELYRTVLRIGVFWGESAWEWGSGEQGSRGVGEQRELFVVEAAD